MSSPTASLEEGDTDFDWSSDSSSVEHDQSSPRESVYSDFPDIGGPLEVEVNSSDEDDDEPQPSRTFKKLARNHRDRNLYRQIGTSERVLRHLTSQDVFQGAKKFLTRNTFRVLDTTNPVQIETNRELSNLRRFEAVEKGIMLRKPSAEVAPNRPRSLDYVFARPRVAGRSLRYTITRTAPVSLPILTDLQIARLISRKPAERVRSAPQAWSATRLYPEYQHVAFLSDLNGKPVMTAEQISQVANDHRLRPISVPIRLEMQKVRAERLTQASWKIIIMDIHKKREKVICPLCNALTQNGKRHMASAHPDSREEFIFDTQSSEDPLQLPIKGADFILPERYYPERRVVEQIAKGILEFLLRWDAPFSLNFPVHKFTVIAVVAQRVGAIVLHTMPKITVQGGRRDLETSRYQIALVDPISLQVYRQSVNIDASSIRNLHPPEVPESVQFADIWTTYLRVNEHHVDESEASPEMRAVVALQKLISYHMEWKAINRGDAIKLIDFYRQQFGYSASFHQDGETSEEHSISTQDKPLALSLVQLKKDRYSAISVLSPTKFLAAGVSKALSNVVIHSIKGSEIAIAVNAALTRWMLDGNVIETWRALCRAADILNADLESGQVLESVCQCNDDDAKFCIHPCDRCLTLIPCNSLKSSAILGVITRVCARCFNKYEVGTRSKSRSEKTKLRASLQVLVKSETRSLNIPTEEKIRQLEETWKEVKSNIVSETEILDGYTGQYFDKIGHQEAVPHRVLCPSIEAVFPFQSFSMSSGDQVIRVHCPGNVTFTLLFFNLAKWISLPGILHIGAYCWSHLRPDSTSVEPEASIHKQVMNKADDMHLVRLKAPYNVQSRLRQPYDEGNYDTVIADWIRGAPRDEERETLVNERTIVQTRYTEPLEWTGFPPGHQRIMSLVLEIEDTSDGRLLRGYDGCPYPFYGDPPRYWNWWMCWSLFSERTARLWEWCNGAWDQVDCAETLFLCACMNQLGMLDPEPFRLPLSIYIKHPLRFVVAHIVHGRQLRSGWTTDTPSSLGEFDRSLHNMAFQTAFSNFGLNDIPNDRYPEAQGQLLNIRIPDKWYQPEHILPIHRNPNETAIGSEIGNRLSSQDLDLNIQDDVVIDKDLGPFEAGSLIRYKDMLRKHWVTRYWGDKDEIWDEFFLLETAFRLDYSNSELAANAYAEALAEEATESLADVDVSDATDTNLISKSAGVEQLNAVSNTLRNIRGFQNANLLCWMNSSMRAIQQLKPLRDKIILFGTSRQRATPMENTTGYRAARQITTLLGQILVAMEAENQKPLNLSILAGACTMLEKLQWEDIQAVRISRGDPVEPESSFRPRWTSGRNQDPAEFIHWLVEVFLSIDVITHNDLNGFLNVCVIRELSCTQCPKHDGNTTWREEPIDVSLKLHFPTLTAKSETVESLLAHTLKQEVVELNEACPEHVPNHNTQSQKSWINTLPEYVIIHFVRTRFQDDGRPIRVPTTIRTKPELDFSDFGRPGCNFNALYSLVCDIHHIGNDSSIDNGHYIAYSKLPVGWTRCDDERISLELPWTQHRGEVSYLLLYKCNNWTRAASLKADKVTVSPPQIHIMPRTDLSLQILSSDPEIPSASSSSPSLPKSSVEIVSFDPYREKYATSIKRYFARSDEAGGICSHTDLLINTFDGCRRKDGTPNSKDETQALLKIWWEALSAVAVTTKVSHHIKMWKLKSNQSIPDIPSGSDRRTWDLSSSDSESEAEVAFDRAPTRILGTSFQLGVMCFRVGWGFTTELTWEPVEAFWRKYEHVPEFRAMVEEVAKNWKLN